METAYREWEKKQHTQRGGQRTATRRHGVTLGLRERQRLLQLLFCLLFFLAVFVGKGVFPEKMVVVREKINQIIGVNTDFKVAFSDLGQSISAGEPVLDTLGELWAEVFGGGVVMVAHTDLPLEHTQIDRNMEAKLRQSVSAETLLGSRFQAGNVVAPLLQRRVVPEPRFAAAPAPVLAPVPTPVPAVIHVEYHGPTLPANATMDQYALGLADTRAPVMGALSSPFGYREHPLDGGEKFHNGVDLAVNMGTDIGAFAGGVVDYIGESPIYGQYIQVRHDNGVTSFYAHCSKLCAQKGQSVSIGEKIAESGDSGNTTGPHLHFELKLNGVLLNPSYYIRTE